LSKGENIVKRIKGQKISWVGHLERMRRIECTKRSTLKNWKTGRDETKRKTQERMERRSRKRSSSAGSEKMERDGHR